MVGCTLNTRWMDHTRRPWLWCNIPLVNMANTTTVITNYTWFLTWRSIQSAVLFTALYSLFSAELFNGKPSQLHWKGSSHATNSARILCVHIYQHMSIARYSFIQLSELWKCRVKKLAHGLTRQHRIQNRVLVVESPELRPRRYWATSSRVRSSGHGATELRRRESGAPATALLSYVVESPELRPRRYWATTTSPFLGHM